MHAVCLCIVKLTIIDNFNKINATKSCGPFRSTRQKRVNKTSFAVCNYYNNGLKLRLNFPRRDCVL
jgi:hypothetical protein